MHAESSGPKGPAPKWNDYRGWAKRIVGYEDTEAKRLGIPMVGISDFAKEYGSNPKQSVIDYIESLFPLRRWILSYNLNWLTGDLIAGITVALVVVPQSMSYANVAGLEAQYGLYSSFVGVVVYALFATSKDVTIGPVAVMSLQTSNVINHVVSKVGEGVYAPQDIASALAFICGVITLGIGLLRLGWIVEFIPVPAVSGFMTGSALTILVGQLPKLFGEKGAKSNDPMYKIAIFFFRNLPNTTIDAAFGIPALIFLYLMRWGCNSLARRYPKYAKMFFFISVLRSAFVIIVLTIASRIWLGTKHVSNYKQYPISVIGPVPRGFDDMHSPYLSTRLLSDLAPQLPASVILLLLEHIAISKSFGRINNYKINPNQELVAIGVTNMVGPCFGGYAATGSFSRTAIKSKSGVRTPIAGWITAIAVLIAIYALSGVFYWIPNASLAAVIIHAVGDLIAPPSQLYKFWLINPLEFAIWVAAVVVTIFTSVDYGVYTSVAASAALLLVRIARPRGNWLGLVSIEHQDPDRLGGIQQRNVFVPLDAQGGLRDPSVHVVPPPPGILIYRVEESFTYPNASLLADQIIDKAKELTRPGSLQPRSNGDRPWNDPGPPNPLILKAWRTVTRKRVTDEKSDTDEDYVDTRPLLHALIFDFSSVSNVDSTSVQILVDVKNTLERYRGGPVQFHFAHLLSPWIRRALLAGGFGTGTVSRHITEVASVVPQLPETRFPSAAEAEEQEKEQEQREVADETAAAGQQGLEQKHTQDASVQDGSAPVGSGATSTGDLERQSSVASDTLKAEDDSFQQDLNYLGEVYRRDHTLTERESYGQIAVPLLWNNEQTPFFHFDVQAALSSASYHVAQDSA
ncbi:hypothetical protein MCUN1_000240 [Malassezia cuniculi]|uniref:STAS domain-containing protein n=1 Tax=Malassezia cuniculi TaxID=948313 RepID=A0AAF0EUZ3_9BASI|nr:hypothetical protein MCUN1_000240 [Malassezia cuniculi]